MVIKIYFHSLPHRDMSLLIGACISALTILLTAYVALQRKYNYWTKKKVPHLKPTLILGNYGGYLTMKEIPGRVSQKLCQAFPKEPYVGAYYGTEPVLIVQDPELLKLITTRDFYYFNSREVMDHTYKETLGASLFSAYGEKWKAIRQYMTPLFTSAKMRNMYHLIQKCSCVFEDMLDREFKLKKEHEIRSILARYTMDCLCSCGFGFDANTMAEDVENNPFHKIGNEIFIVSSIRTLLLYGRAICPSIFYGVGLRKFPKEISDFFNKLMTGIFESRKYTPTTRNDFVDLILGWTKANYLTTDDFAAKNTKEMIKVKIDDQLLVAQCFIFFIAGFETSANTMSFTLYELAKHPEALKRAIQEVDEYLLRNNNNIGYNCVTELPYLEACLDEALRLYPVLSNLTREVVENYTLPTGLRLEKGLRIHMPVYHLHHNPKYFPDPEQYRPERFLAGEKKNIKSCTYMPFGEGQRICIGMRFAKMQTLTGLVTLLKKYRVELAEGMPREIEFEPRCLVTISNGGIKLRLVEREGWQHRLFTRQPATDKRN